MSKAITPSVGDVVSWQIEFYNNERFMGVIVSIYDGFVKTDEGLKPVSLASVDTAEGSYYRCVNIDTLKLTAETRYWESK